MSDFVCLQLKNIEKILIKNGTSANVGVFRDSFTHGDSGSAA